MYSSNNAHVVLYPVPAPGHVIPLLDFTQQLLTNGLNATVLLTPRFLPLLDPLLSRYSSQLHHLLLPTPPPPTTGLLGYLCSLNDVHYPIILDWLRSHNLPPITAIISDFFAGWNQKLANEVGVPHIVFSPSGALGFSVLASMWRDKPHYGDPDDMQPLVSFNKIPNSPSQPWWQMCLLYREYKVEDPNREFFGNNFLANLSSWGIVFNSFSELERDYLQHMKDEYFGDDRVWAVGPVMPLDTSSQDISKRGGSSTVPSHEVLTWLDGKKDDSVVFVCFGTGTAASLTCKQMDVLASALEKSGVHFIWAMKNTKEEKKNHPSGDYGLVPDDFQDQVGERGFIIQGWAPQVAILKHRAVGTFLTHCGWNSLLEGVALAGVMTLTWPLGGDQYSNEQLLVDELGIGIRVGGGTKKIPESSELARVLAESVEHNRTERVQAKKLREAATNAVKGGSSQKDLHDLVKKLNEIDKCGLLS